MLVPLHVKSHYSLGYGIAAVTELVDRAVGAGLPGLALTDLENLYGQVKFHHACGHRGLKPITGVELRRGFDGREPSGERRNRLVLLARDRSGYESVCRIVSRRRAGLGWTCAQKTGAASAAWGTTSPRTTGLVATGSGMAGVGAGGEPIDALGEDVAGLFILTDDPAALDRLLRLGVDRACLRALLVRPGPSDRSEEPLVEIARKGDVRLVADPDIVMLDAADHRLHLLQFAIRRRETVSTVRRDQHVEPPERRFRAPAELERLFRDVPQALEETHRISECCDLDLRHADPVLPEIALPEGETPSSRLQRVCRERLEPVGGERRRSGELYDRRLGEELAIIEQLGVGAYFLVVAEIVRFARARGIQVAGRGSAVGSLVVHLLGISDVDPVAQGLLFERFLHPRRRDLPDIDIDVCSERRDELIDWVFHRFGEEKVAMVSALATFLRRSAYREGLKALGVPPREVESFCRRIPPDDLEAVAQQSEAGIVGWATSRAAHVSAPEEGAPTRREGPGVRPPSLAMPVLPQPYRKAGPLIERLIGTPRHFSVHPGGLVIADRRIDGYVPLERAAKGVVAAQYDMHSIQHTGLIKIDLLGNHCLTEFQETVRLLGERQPRGLDSKVGAVESPASGEASGTVDRGARAPSSDATGAAGMVLGEGLSAIPDADPDTLATLNRADTIGCFQLESPAMRSLLAQIPIRGLSDCIAALALVRPGAAAGDAKLAFVRRAHGEEAPDCLHPRLEEFLKDTHGVLLYEEDILRVMSVLSGMSLTEADELRSAIHEWQDEPEELARLRARFLHLADENGIELVAAGTAWEAVLRFASYSFSKAHASSYGRLGYQAAYLRTHFPVEFGCAVLNHHGGMYPLRTLGAAVERWGVTLLPPSVNRSEAPCTVEAVPFGARGVSGEIASGVERAVSPGRQPPEPTVSGSRPVSSGAEAAAAAAFERAVRIGLGKVKRLSRRSLSSVLQSRDARGPFASVRDLLGRVPLSSRELEALVLAGACNDLPPLSREAYPFAHEVLLEALRRRSQTDAFEDVATRLAAPRDSADPEALNAYRSLVRIQNELKFLEMHVSEHPMRVLRAEAECFGCVTTAEAASRRGEFVRLGGILAAARSVPTKDGGVMQFVTVEDERGTLEAVIFPSTYRHVGGAISTPGPFLLAGRVEEDHGDVHLIVSETHPFHERHRMYPKVAGRLEPVRSPSP